MRRLRPVTIALLAALLTCPLPTKAEVEVATAPVGEAPRREGAWNLSLGTGGGGVFEFADAFADSRPRGYDERRSGRLQLNARLDRELGRRLRVGLAYTYLGWTDEYASGGVAVPGSIAERAQVLLLDATVPWHRGEHVELYGALAAGYGRWRASGTVAGVRYDDTSSGFAFQVRYFGVSVGNERLRAFAELGIGFEGLIVGGVTLRL